MVSLPIWVVFVPEQPRHTEPKATRYRLHRAALRGGGKRKEFLSSVSGARPTADR